MKKKMNWNLNRINKNCQNLLLRITLTLVITIQMNELVQAQSKSIFNIGFSLSPAISGSTNNSDQYLAYCDSSKSTKGTRLTGGGHVWVTYSLKKKLDLQVGIGFQDLGFSRTQSSLNYGQRTYPGIGSGKILDISNTQKQITYNYKFQYLQIPIMLNSYINHSNNYKWVYNFSAGFTANFLLKHQLQANLIPGFTIDTQKSFKLDSTGFDARRFALNIVIGSRIEYKADKLKTYFLQPLIGYFPVSIAGISNRSNPWFFSLNVGVLISMKKISGK